MYKAKDKQREAVKEATRRYRAKNGDSALSGSKDALKNARGLLVVDELSDTQPVIPSCDTFPKTTRLPTHKRGKDIKCFGDLPMDVQETMVIPKRAKTLHQVLRQERTAQGNIRVSKPGDADYNGICTEEWIKERKGEASWKREDPLRGGDG